MQNEENADRVRKVLSGFGEVMLAYLFGSRAGGKPGPQSDYDFGLLVEGAQNEPTLRARLAHELGQALETDRIDVVILNRVPIELAYAVIAQGRLLFQRDDATRVEYEAQVMSRYGDYLPVLRSQRREIHRGGEHAARVHRYREALGRTERKIGEIRAAQDQAP